MMSAQTDYKREIIQLQAEMRRLLNDLGQSQSHTDSCLFGSTIFNQYTYLQHLQRYEALHAEWNDISDDLDDLLDDLQHETSDEEYKSYEEKHSDTNLGNQTDLHPLHEISEHDRFSWTGKDGQQYQLFTRVQMQEHQNGCKSKYLDRSQQFRQFRRAKKQQLTKQTQPKSGIQITMITENDKGCAFNVTW